MEVIYNHILIKLTFKLEVVGNAFQREGKGLMRPTGTIKC